MKTLIINKSYLILGGIETFIFSLVQYAISQNYRVIWLAGKPLKIFHGFKEILDKIEICYTGRGVCGAKVINRLKFSEEDSVTILSFTPFDHNRAIKIKQKHTNITITPIYILPNTRGDLYYIEGYFSWPLSHYVKKKMSNIIGEWAEHGDIRYFTQLQRIACEKNYGITFSDVDGYRVPSVNKVKNLDEGLLIKRGERERFNIISVSRLEFPHKQYILGLVDAYAQLKSKYRQLTLYIIGYGTGEKLLRRKIDVLPEAIRKDIFFLGAKTSAEIDEIMKDMHLNISTAGSVVCGARNGVVSLPARNFCGDICEVYGYMPESRDKATSTEPGMPVVPFIEELINMSKEDYMLKCKTSYDTVTNQNVDPEYLFRQRSVQDVTYNNHHLFFAIMYVLKDCVKIFRIIKKKMKK